MFNIHRLRLSPTGVLNIWTCFVLPAMHDRVPSGRMSIQGQCCSPFCLLLHLPDYKPHNILNSLTLYVQHYLVCLIHICINYWPCNETEAYWFWLDHNNVFTLCFLYQNLEFIKTNKPFHGYVLSNSYGGHYNDKTIIQVDRGNIIYINHEFRI